MKVKADSHFGNVPLTPRDSCILDEDGLWDTLTGVNESFTPVVIFGYLVAESLRWGSRDPRHDFSSSGGARGVRRCGRLA